MSLEAVLVFGLSADPVHRGHVEMVVQSFRRLVNRGHRMARVILLPVYRRNPVGSAKERLAQTYHGRYVMCTLAAQQIAHRLDLPRRDVVVSDVEAQLAAGRDRPNYTAETLLWLKLRTRRRLIFLISSELVSGTDPQFGRWHEPRTILRLADLAICPRPGYAPNRRFLAALDRQGGRVLYLPDVETPDISSTKLRHALSKGQSPLALARRGLLSPAIARYLHVRSFYEDEGGE